MFATYKIAAGQQIDVKALGVAAATGIGTGLAVVISHGKLQNSAVVIDDVPNEQDVI